MLKGMGKASPEIINAVVAINRDSIDSLFNAVLQLSRSSSELYCDYQGAAQNYKRQRPPSRQMAMRKPLVTIHVTKLGRASISHKLQWIG